MGDLNPNGLKRKPVKNTVLPRNVKNMSKEQLIATIKKKRECNAKALAIVEQMIEHHIDTHWFLEQLRFIDVGHFQDIIEERALCKICGYPLCCENLKNIPSQQYRISTKYNKVYDITERKNFCSNECYKASKFVRDQLLTTPLWLRDKEETRTFQLLPLGTQGSGAGEEVDLGHIGNLKSEVKKLDKETKFMSVADFTQDSIKQLSKRVDNAELREKHKTEVTDDPINTSTNEIETICNNMELVSLQKEEKEDDRNISSENRAFSVPKVDTKALNLNSVEKEIESIGSSNNIINPSESSKPVIGNEEKAGNNNGSNTRNECSENKEIKQKEKVKQMKNDTKSQESVCPEETSSIIHLEKCLFEWFTVESMCFLFGEEKVKDMVSDKGDCIKEYYKAVGKSFWDPVMQERYEALCRKLNLMEIQENLEDKEEKELKPLPDYRVLQEESLKMNFKIQAFYEGKLSFDIPNIERNDTPQKMTPSCVLPLVDLHAQNALRRRIILDNLKRVLPDLLRTFGLTSRDISTDVRNLISTFTLSAHNITFKPTEWNLLSLVIMKMLSIRDMKLKMLMETQQGIKYQTMLLMAYHQDGGYLDRLMHWLTDLDNLMKKKV